MKGKKLDTLGAQLRGVGYQVVTAMDAMQAFMVAQRSASDAVLLDIQMPGGTGFDTLKRLRTSTKTQNLPVIAMSALPGAEWQTRALALGAVEFFAKPVDFARLRELLARLLEPPEQSS